MQIGLYSLLGLVMATSGCPHLDFLRPLALHPLPFSSIHETVFRVSSSYLTEQYFRENDAF